MAARLIDNEKTTRNSDNNDIENEFDIEITQLVPSFLRSQTDSKNENTEEKTKKIKNKKDEEDEKENNSETNEDTDDDDSPKFRDKDKELKEAIKSGLSLESQDVINMNDDEFNAIIEQLKKEGISQDKGIELQKIRNVTRRRNGINR